jgi:hypothetical protein
LPTSGTWQKAAQTQSGEGGQKEDKRHATHYEREHPSIGLRGIHLIGIIWQVRVDKVLEEDCEILGSEGADQIQEKTVLVTE